MLKIKKNVDLKELEKFDYSYDDFNECWDKEITENVTISIYEETKYISIIYFDYEGDYIEQDEFNEDIGELEYIDDLTKARNSRKSLGGNMENNEDIKIVEEKIKALNLHIDNYYKNDCETSVCKELVKERNALENLLSRLKTAERMNDVYVEEIRARSIFYNVHNGSFSCCDLSKEKDGDCSKYGNKDNCKQCIKEWARKKVENDSSCSNER